MTDRPTILTNLRPLEDFLASAHRFGVPMPFSVSATDYDGCRISVRADEFSAWVDYLKTDPGPFRALSDGSGDTHRTIISTIPDTDVPVVVSCIQQARVTA